MDNAPDVSDEYSFLLESSVLDRDGSPASPAGGDAFAHFAVSKLSQVGGWGAGHACAHTHTPLRAGLAGGPRRGPGLRADGD